MITNNQQEARNKINVKGRKTAPKGKGQTQ